MRAPSSVLVMFKKRPFVAKALHIAVSRLRQSQKMALDKHDPLIPSLVINIICQTFFYGEPCRTSRSYIPSINLFTNPGSSRYIFLSLSHLDLRHGVRDLPSNPPDARSIFLKEFRDGIAPRDSKLDHGSGSLL